MKKSIKRIALAILVTGAVFSSTFISLAGWEQSEQGWKYKDDNTQQYVTARWIESANEAGLWYYIKADGIMATNSLIDGVYYVNELGEWRESTGGSISVNPGNQSNTGGQTGNNQNSSNFHSIELGDKPIQSDPEFDQEFNEGIIR